MQNFEPFAAGMKSKGAFSLPLGDALVSYVDADDIAAVAAEVLLGNEMEHSGRAYDLTGPDALTGSQVAEIFSQVLGRKIEFHAVSDDRRRTL